jgi:hypothetical protein
LRSREWPQFFTLSLQTIDILREINQVPNGQFDDDGNPIRVFNTPRLEAQIQEQFIKNKSYREETSTTTDFEGDGYHNPIIMINPTNHTIQDIYRSALDDASVQEEEDDGLDRGEIVTSC